MEHDIIHDLWTPETYGKGTASKYWRHKALAALAALVALVALANDTGKRRALELLFRLPDAQAMRWGVDQQPIAAFHQSATPRGKEKRKTRKKTSARAQDHKQSDMCDMCTRHCFKFQDISIQSSWWFSTLAGKTQGLVQIFSHRIVSGHLPKWKAAHELFAQFLPLCRGVLLATSSAKNRN